MPARIKADDDVVVIGGKDARQARQGAAGRARRRTSVYVEGLNMIKRHQRPQQVAGAQRAEQVGGVIEKEGPIHISNVMLVDPKDGKPTRVKIEVIEGKRHRVAVRSGTRID